MESSQYNYLFKFVIVGDSGVGKSCLALNFTENKPRRAHKVTVACEFSSTMVEIQKKMIKLQLWDTAGQENFKSITRTYYKGSVAAIIVYDITSRKSFDNLENWINDVKEIAHDNVSLALVGNKIDLEREREVSYQEGYKLAKAHKMRFTETCAFEATTIEPLFKGLAEDVLQKITSGRIDARNEQYGVRIGELSKKSTHSGDSADTTSSSKSGDKDSRGSSKKRKGCC